MKVTIQPFFVSSEEELYANLNLERRDVRIEDKDKKVIFAQDGVEFPSFWSKTAAQVVAQKYFRGNLGDKDREHSLVQLVDRVVNQIEQWGISQEYFSRDSARNFALDLKYMIYNQYYAFNSPVWFNVGAVKKPQVSACFIQGLQDDMNSILNLQKSEALIFKGGSGSGTNFSSLRAKNEPLSGGGRASGPVSFMKGFDAHAGIIRSGGKTRRAAKMAILDDDHPDIQQFITCKLEEDKKAAALVAAGYSPDFNADDGAYATVAFQNENHSVRISDGFMNAVLADDYWVLKYKNRRTNKELRVKARDIFDDLCVAAQVCGDPGVQFSDTINRYHTTPLSGKINASNPCSEYFSIDDSACNLGSLNLMRFTYSSGGEFQFDSDTFQHCVMIATIAQEILIDNASYPTKKIEKNVRDHRQLGIGYANIGTALMYSGYPYDSVEGRSIAAAITSLMTSTVYSTSASIAKVKGPFAVFEKNKQHVLDVMLLHARNCKDINTSGIRDVKIMKNKATQLWSHVIDSVKDGEGIRNSQATLLAPTGTIGFMMDCDTTGVEPEVALTKVKNLVGGGVIPITNKNFGPALKNLGYDEEERSKITEYLLENYEIENCSIMKREHLSVFDCAYPSGKGTRCIKPEGHLRMLAAIQPHVSGGISKTIGMPTNATVDDVRNIVISAHAMGVKSLTVYRDGSKLSQPYDMKKKEEKAAEEKEIKKIYRRHLPDERKSITHKFEIGGAYKGYLTTGFFPSNEPGEIFIESAKAGSTMNGLLDCLATAVSIGLQHGVPLEKYVKKFSYISFLPNGYSRNPDIGYARSIVDYIFRYLEKFVVDEKKNIVNIDVSVDEPDEIEEIKSDLKETSFTSDAPPCSQCGSLTIRNGTCYICENCGTTTGCS